MGLVNAPWEDVVLPNLGRALVAAGERLNTISAEDDEAKPFYFEDYSGCVSTDMLGVPVPKGTPEVSLRRMVQQEKDRSDVLFFFLASLDKTLTLSIREEAATFVEDLLSENDLYQYAEMVLLSEPFRATKDAPLELYFPTLAKYEHLFHRIQAHQQAAHSFWRAWNALANEAGSLALSFDLDSLRDLLLSFGLTSKLIQAIHETDLMAFNTQIVNLAVQPEVRDRFPTATQVLTKLRNLLNEQNAFSTRQTNINASETLSAEWDVEGGVTWSQKVGSLFDHEIYSQVTKQINSIKPLLFTGSRTLVDRAVRELLEFQKLHSDPEYIAKTLCNLAKIAINANEIDIAKDLSDQASVLGVHDPVVDSTAAEVMKNLGRFAEAKVLYEASIIKFGQDEYLLNGLADVLKEYGDFSGALEIYERMEVNFPFDPVAPNGISTVYFAMGHLEKALKKAQNNVIMFGDVVSRIICGNILRHLGRNHESLALMHEALDKFPREMAIWTGYIRSLGLVGRHQDALKKCGELITALPDQPMPRLLQGDLLRKFGKLSESLATFNKALTQFPSHRGLQLGKASVLLLQGEAAEAAKFAQIGTPQSELDWRMFHIFSSSFIRLGEYREALSLLEKGLEIVPWLKLRSLFSDTIGYVKLRMGDARAAIEAFRVGLRTADRAKRNGLYLLLSRAYLELGNYEQSARYVHGVTSNDPPVNELKAATTSEIRSLTKLPVSAATIQQNEFQMLLAAA